jgi:hypothetical protein
VALVLPLSKVAKLDTSKVAVLLEIFDPMRPSPAWSQFRFKHRYVVEVRRWSGYHLYFQRYCGRRSGRDNTLPTESEKKRRLYSRLLPLQETSVICTHNNWPDNLTGHRYPIRLASLPISALENRTNRPSSQELPSKPWNPTSSQPPTPSQRSCSTWPCPHRGAGG